MQDVHRGYALALLTDLHKQEPLLSEKLDRRRQGAETVRSTLEAALEEGRKRLALQHDEEKKIKACKEQIQAFNGMLPTLYREIEVFRRQKAMYEAKMRGTKDAIEQREFRSAAAKADAQSVAHEEELAGIGVKVKALHETMKEHERVLQALLDARNIAAVEIRKMRSKWPMPADLAALFDVRMGMAHAEWLYHPSWEVWCAHAKRANALAEELNMGFMQGFYAPEVHSDWVGGRQWIGSESVYASVLMGDLDQAKALFAGAARDDMMFDHMFHIYRLWTVGLYLHDRHDDLLRMLRRHRYADGIRGAYTQAWAGILAGDVARLQEALQCMIDDEFKTWSNIGSARAMGLVCVPASALLVLAKRKGMHVTLKHPRLIYTGL